MTLEQSRAADALARASAVAKDESDRFKTRYRGYVDRLGPAIVMNGLGQALASERAAAGPEARKEEERAHDRLHANVQAWLCREDAVYGGASDVLEAIVSNEEEAYLRAQAEVLAWLEWHKKFCRAALPAADVARPADEG